MVEAGIDILIYLAVGPAVGCYASIMNWGILPVVGRQPSLEARSAQPRVGKEAIPTTGGECVYVESLHRVYRYRDEPPSAEGVSIGDDLAPDTLESVTMILRRKPSAEAIRGFLAQQASLNLTYHAVGATATTPPAGYVVDRTRSKIGEGEQVFLAAQAALRRWQQFDLGWIEASPADTPIEAGQVVAILARAIGLWWLNACRIVYVVEDAGEVSRFGFAYGTLPTHAGTGEERFLIEWNHATNEVWYDILAFSRMKHPLTRLGYPVVRRTQKQFGRESAAAMLRAVRRASHTPN